MSGQMLPSVCLQQRASLLARKIPMREEYFPRADTAQCDTVRMFFPRCPWLGPIHNGVSPKPNSSGVLIRLCNGYVLANAFCVYE